MSLVRIQPGERDNFISMLVSSVGRTSDSESEGAWFEPMTSSVDTQIKRCSRCKEDKPVTEFHRMNNRGDGFQNNCKKCNTKQKSTWIQQNRDKVKWNALWNRHRLRREDLEQLLREQGDRCAICSDPITVDTLHIDHDHACCPDGKSCEDCRRGLLCQGCNLRVGWYESVHKTETERLIRKYLKLGPLE
jgi:hypothetical protein